MKQLTKKQVLERLNATLKNLEELPSRNFDYSSYVTRSKITDEGTCGTVCCAAGWYPKWFPEAGLKWMDGDLTVANRNKHNVDITNTLANYHGINKDLINILFYGDEKNFKIEGLESDKYVLPFLSLRTTMTLGLKHGENSKRNDVIKMFKTVINLIKNDLIDYK